MPNVHVKRVWLSNVEILYGLNYFFLTLTHTRLSYTLLFIYFI